MSEPDNVLSYTVFTAKRVSKCIEKRLKYVADLRDDLMVYPTEVCTPSVVLWLLNTLESEIRRNTSLIEQLLLSKKD